MYTKFILRYNLGLNIFIFFYRCSVDPYLFENFNTVDGDFLSAKFRAFKFPESTYVQFKGTVNVCLDKCRGVCLKFLILYIKKLFNLINIETVCISMFINHINIELYKTKYTKIILLYILIKTI